MNTYHLLSCCDGDWNYWFWRTVQKSFGVRCCGQSSTGLTWLPANQSKAQSKFSREFLSLSIHNKQNIKKKECCFINLPLKVMVQHFSCTKVMLCRSTSAVLDSRHNVTVNESRTKTRRAFQAGSHLYFTWLRLFTFLCPRKKYR